MDNVGAANGSPPLFFNPRNNEDTTISNSNFIDLTGDDDAKSDSSDDDLVELTPAQMELALAEKNIRDDGDTLDVSKLNYSFKMLHRKQEHQPLEKQVVPINSFLRVLDRNNTAYQFTHAQYRRAWGYAIKLNENQFAINHILLNNRDLDRAGIEAEFAQQVQQIIDKVCSPNVLL